MVLLAEQVNGTTLRWGGGQPFSADIVDSYPACNGWLHIANNMWAASVPEMLPNSGLQPITPPVSDLPVLTYQVCTHGCTCGTSSTACNPVQPECGVNESFGPPDSFAQWSRSVAANSSDPARVWTLLSRFLPPNVSYDQPNVTNDAMVVQLRDASFTLFLPWWDHGGLDIQCTCLWCLICVGAGCVPLVAIWMMSACRMCV